MRFFEVTGYLLWVRSNCDELECLQLSSSIFLFFFQPRSPKMCCLRMTHPLKLLLDLLEFRLRCPASRADPVLGKILEGCSRAHSRHWVSICRIVHITTDLANPLVHGSLPADRSASAYPYILCGVEWRQQLHGSTARSDLSVQESPQKYQYPLREQGSDVTKYGKER